jgi:phage terminase small subunit
MAKRKLTPLQERFKNNILKGMDAKTAYIKAGYKARGAAAEVNASRLLRNAKVKATIDEAQKRAAQRAEVTCERILEEYAKIAFLNPKRIFDRKGKLKKVHEIDDDTASAIGGFDVLQKSVGKRVFEITKKIKLIDKKGALDSLARIQGMFNDKLNLGFTAEALNAILTGLPDEYARAVREALAKLVSSRGN